MKLLALLRQVYDFQGDAGSNLICPQVDCGRMQCLNCPLCPLQSRDDLVPRLEPLCETPDLPECPEL